MKNIYILSALITFIIFTSCNDQVIEDDLVPASQESVILPANYKADDSVNDGKADFTISNEDNTLLEKDVLLLNNKSVNAVSYKWDFGNGDTSTEALPNYKYEIHGNYTVTLTVTDANNNVHQAKREVLVLCLFGGGNHDE